MVKVEPEEVEIEEGGQVEADGDDEEEAILEAQLKSKGKGKKGKGRKSLLADSQAATSSPASIPRRGSGRHVAPPPPAIIPPLETKPAAPKVKPPPKPKPVPANFVTSGSYKRLKLTVDDPLPIEPTHPVHLTIPGPAFDGSVEALIESYKAVDDDPDLLPLSKQPYGGKPITRLSLDERFEREAFLRIRIEQLQAEGRLGGPVDEDEDPASSTRLMFNANLRKPPRLPAQSIDHWAHVLQQGTHFSDLVRDERARHVAAARRTAKMVMLYWDRKDNEVEREKEKEERELVKKAKWTVREVRKKWRLAVNVSQFSVPLFAPHLTRSGLRSSAQE